MVVVQRSDGTTIEASVYQTEAFYDAQRFFSASTQPEYIYDKDGYHYILHTVTRIEPYRVKVFGCIAGNRYEKLAESKDDLIHLANAVLFKRVFDDIE